MSETWEWLLGIKEIRIGCEKHTMPIRIIGSDWRLESARLLGPNDLHQRTGNSVEDFV